MLYKITTIESQTKQHKKKLQNENKKSTKQNGTTKSCKHRIS